MKVNWPHIHSRQIVASKGSKVDFTVPGVAQALVDECYDKYCSGESIREASKAEDGALYNLRLRLRDLATVVEADHAMRAGDIGRLLSMWKRWSILAQGLKGLSHYALHLPRYILILEKYLPKTLAKVIKHSLLIPSSGREGHWVAKDFFLEVQNYWLKYFYNNSVSTPFGSKDLFIYQVIFSIIRDKGQTLKGLQNAFQ